MRSILCGLFVFCLTSFLYCAENQVQFAQGAKKAFKKKLRPEFDKALERKIKKEFEKGFSLEVLKNRLDDAWQTYEIIASETTPFALRARVRQLFILYKKNRMKELKLRFNELLAFRPKMDDQSLKDMKILSKLMSAPGESLKKISINLFSVPVYELLQRCAVDAGANLVFVESIPEKFKAKKYCLNLEDVTFTRVIKILQRLEPFKVAEENGVFYISNLFKRVVAKKKGQVNIDIRDEKDSKRKYSIKVKNASVGKLLESLSKSSGKIISFPQYLHNHRFSMQFNDVELESLLKLIASSIHFNFVRDGENFCILDDKGIRRLKANRESEEIFFNQDSNEDFEQFFSRVNEEWSSMGKEFHWDLKIIPLPKKNAVKLISRGFLKAISNRLKKELYKPIISCSLKIFGPKPGEKDNVAFEGKLKVDALKKNFKLLSAPQILVKDGNKAQIQVENKKERVPSLDKKLFRTLEMLEELKKTSHLLPENKRKILKVIEDLKIDELQQIVKKSRGGTTTFPKSENEHLFYRIGIQPEHKSGLIHLKINITIRIIDVDKNFERELKLNNELVVKEGTPFVFPLEESSGYYMLIQCSKQK
ncbi:hypothetical protein ACFL35_02230 [Candidatus Riflebacteria bacterium]